MFIVNAQRTVPSGSAAGLESFPGEKSHLSIRPLRSPSILPASSGHSQGHGQRQQTSPSPQAGSSVQWVHTWRDFPCWCLMPSPTSAFYHIRRGPGPIHPCRNPHSPLNTSYLMFRGSHARGSSIMTVQCLLLQNCTLSKFETTHFPTSERCLWMTNWSFFNREENFTCDYNCKTSTHIHSG